MPSSIRLTAKEWSLYLPPLLSSYEVYESARLIPGSCLTLPIAFWTVDPGNQPPPYPGIRGSRRRAHRAAGGASWVNSSWREGASAWLELVITGRAGPWPFMVSPGPVVFPWLVEPIQKRVNTVFHRKSPGKKVHGVVETQWMRKQKLMPWVSQILDIWAVCCVPLWEDPPIRGFMNLAVSRWRRSQFLSMLHGK